MKQGDYYEFTRTYDYESEIPYDGATEDGIEDAHFVYGTVAWEASIIWNESEEAYVIDRSWEDYGNNFSQIGDGPMEDEFHHDLYSYLESLGIDYDDDVA